jgi:hypothetical protein
MASTNAIQGPPSNLTNTIDGITSFFSNGQQITGNYLNSITNTLGVNTTIFLDNGGSFIIRDTNGNAMIQIIDPIGTTVFNRPQSSFSPVSSSDLVNLSYLNSLVSAYITSFGTTTIQNKVFKLSANPDSFVITDNANNVLMSVNSSGSVSVFSRIQCSFSPSASSDLIPLSYLQTQLTGYIKTLGGSQVQGLVLTMSGGSDSIRFVSFSGTTQLQIFDSGTTVILRPQSSFTPSTGNDLTNKTYVDGLGTGYVPYSGATTNIDINTRNFTTQYNKIDNSLIGCGVVTTSIATVGGTQNIFWRPNFVGPYYGWILSSEASLNVGVDLNIRIPYLYSDTITSSGTISASGIISTTSSITASGSITSTSSNIIGFKGIFENNLNTGPPSVGQFGGAGDHLILYRGGTSENPYSIGIDSYTLWLSASGNSVVSESLFNILFYSGQRARWKMNGTATTANFTSQQTYMNISDQSNNKVVSTLASLSLSTTSNTPIIFTTDGGASNNFLVQGTFATGYNLNLLGSLGPISGAILRFGNETSLGSGYDCIEFVRVDSNPVIRCGGNFIVPYASGAGSFVSGALIGDMILRTASGDSIRFTVNDGLSSALSIITNSLVGIENPNPPSKFFVNQSFVASGNPQAINDWGAIHSVFSNSTGSRSAGLGVAMDSSSTSAGAWLLSIAPNISWNPFNISASRINILAVGAIFNINYLGTGTVYSNGGTLTNTNPSDIRLKNTITPLQNNTDIINQLNPVSFLWNDQQKHGSKLQLGFIAQEVQKVLPVIVSEYKEPIIGPSNLTDEHGMRIDEYTTNLGVDTMALIPFLVGAVKEQNQTINLLLSHMKQLTEQVNALTTTRKNSIKK